MKITFLIVGKTTNQAIQHLMENYTKRLCNYCNLTVIQLPDLKQAVAVSPIEYKQKEASQIKKHLSVGDYIIVLDEQGNEFTSPQFAQFIQKKQFENRKHIVFVVGGAYGFSDEIYALASEKIACSKMTFTHQLIRVIFLEQLYRAFTILNNEPYHH